MMIRRSLTPKIKYTDVISIVSYFFTIMLVIILFQAILKELFPSIEVVMTNIEVIKFCAGLMSDPKPLVGYVYDFCIDKNLNNMRIGSGPSVDEFEKTLFESLYSEVHLPVEVLHNPWLNWCEESD